jgi:hypothetical protein
VDDRALTEQLCGWLDPWRLASLAAQYAKDPAPIEQPRRITQQATAIRRAADVGLDRLIRAFVDNFELSAETAAILPGASLLQFSSEALRRFTGLRFTGEVSFEAIEGDPEGTVVAFTGPTVEILTIAGPINFLVAFVDQTSQLWSAFDPAVAFYEPSFHGELPIYIESTVARALGFRVDAAFSNGKPQLNHRPNAGVTMAGTPPFDRAAAVRIWSTASRRELPAPRGAAGEQVPAAFAEGDGLVLLDATEAASPWRNVEHLRNECSPYSGVESPQPRSDGKVMVDSYYGRTFDFVLAERSAVYGFTEDLARISPRADRGYLRVPYRCIPRLQVRSRADVDGYFATLRGPADEHHLLVRGQTGEYYLNRSAAALNALYGDAQALEPSLPASAVRKHQPLEAVLPQWCFFIRSYALGLLTRLMQSDPSSSDRLSDRLQQDLRRLERSLDNHAFAFSLAQHYGLPSMGLDLTDQLEPALFFALHRFEGGQRRELRPVRVSDGQPVLYVFLLPDRFCVEHARARPQLFPRGRPDTQSAWFSHMGWGYHRNQCAEYLVAALYLDVAGDYGALPAAAQLFPSQPDDMFGSLMEVALERGWASPELTAFLTRLYWVQ